MSGSDIRDILEIGKPTANDNVPRKAKPTIEKRPEGISRELYSLIGGPPPASLLQPTYKAKFTTKKKAVPWALHSFTNPARSDDLELYHWIRAKEANQKGYPFCRFDSPRDMLHYTNDEYDNYLKDHSWSKEETDVLMRLCDKYDLKFTVIADRFDVDPQRPRSIEDIKERFYTVQERLHEIHGQPYEHSFNKEREVARKHARRVLFARTKEEQEQEDYVAGEVQRLEQQRAKLAKERDHVRTLLDQNTQQQQALIPLTKKKGKPKDPSKEKKRKRKLDKEDAEAKSKMLPGVAVQSQMLSNVKQHLQSKSFKILNELGIGSRPVMPTAAICQRFQVLEHSITTLLELKKAVDKMEVEHRISQKRRRTSATG
ncbi:hypothetical protein DM01DRAFT_1332683 [Hesseltinella vesiculosa]|uniref:SWR1-complex protein 4 n=1 Tax=Hesseltinella vesiculosa TaxID=101127 RepID=A0A1X2GSV6_9FUNG|nr:hypothetical protein DM01DRAFT_1332683 [Hesseltinella vesiculosa]